MDLLIQETYDGGDLVATKRDVTVVDGFENMPYLGMFGGNPEQSTPLVRLQSEHAFDWWGNTLFFPNDESRQINLITEATLDKVVLNSAGRQTIEDAIKEDLSFMSPFANVAVSVSIIGPESILIGIKVVKPTNLEQKLYVYIWDKTIAELTQFEGNAITNQVVIKGKIFSFQFDFTFA